MFCVCVLVCVVVLFLCVDRDHQQSQRASSVVSTCFVGGRGPSGRDTGSETGLERGAGEEADL